MRLISLFFTGFLTGLLNSGDSPTVGIILCADKDDTVVRYSVLNENPQLFASKYRLVLPSEEELRDELDRRHILQLPALDFDPNPTKLGESTAIGKVSDLEI